MANFLDRISIDPAVCVGKPCIRGTRIWVSFILDLLAGGMPEANLRAEEVIADVRGNLRRHARA